YNLAHPSVTGNQFPYLVNCHDANDLALGSFKTTLTVIGSTAADYSWSIPLAAPPAGGAGSGQTATATTTTLSAAASGANLVLSATVAPAAAGKVTFKDGGAPLGAAVSVVGGVATTTVEAPSNGVHSYSADFVPTDAVTYAASSAAPQDFTVGAAQNGSITVTLGVPAAPVDAPGSLTFTVPANATLALAGQRDTNNTRVTATGTLPALTVEDTRGDGLLTGWQVNVQASDFVGTAGTVGAKYLGWVPALPTITKATGGPLNVQAGAAVASFLDDNTSGGLATSQLLSKSTVSGRGTTTLNAALNLAIPGTTAEGSYTSTVTVTLIGG
ncbi:MAG TPA: Ig-like domain-containing protein, partial [Cellulomonas sp.]|nr:Ig-like domain-containing protein [Cellulomonas sp.]